LARRRGRRSERDKIRAVGTVYGRTSV